MHGFPACKKCIKVSKASWAEYLILRGSFKSIKNTGKSLLLTLPGVLLILYLLSVLYLTACCKSRSSFCYFVSDSVAASVTASAASAAASV